MTILIPKNRNQSLNPTFNAFVTDCRNVLQRRIGNTELEFIKKGYRKNVIGGVPFTHLDFLPEIKKNYFRKLKHDLKPIIIQTVGGKPKFYQLKGLYLDEKLTEEYTALPVDQRLFANLDILLAMVKHQPPAIHDIRIQATTSGLYERLVQLGEKPHKKNKIITLTLGQLTPLINTKVCVHSTGTLVVILGCTYHPIPYSPKGFITLISNLGSVRTWLQMKCSKPFQIEPTMNWKFKYFHFNRDSIEYNFPTNQYTVNIVFDHVQVYKKRMLNGSTVIRVEKHIVPNTTIAEELQKMESRQELELM